MLFILLFVPFAGFEVCEIGSSGKCHSYVSNSTITTSLVSFSPLQNIFCCATCTHKDITNWGLFPAWVSLFATLAMILIFTLAMVLRRGRIPKAVISLIAGASTIIVPLLVHEQPAAHIAPLITWKSFLIITADFNAAYQILIALAIAILLVGLLEAAQKPAHLFGLENTEKKSYGSPVERERRIGWPRIQLQPPKLPHRAPSEPRRREPELQPENKQREDERESEPEGHATETENVEQENVDTNSPLMCPHCGRELQSGMQYCPFCRKPVEEAREQPAEVEPVESDETEETVTSGAKPLLREKLSQLFHMSPSDLAANALSGIVQGAEKSRAERFEEYETQGGGLSLVQGGGWRRWRLAGFKYDNPYLNWGFVFLGVVMFLAAIWAGFMEATRSLAL